MYFSSQIPKSGQYSTLVPKCCFSMILNVYNALMRWFQIKYITF